MKLEILKETPDWIAINKPSGIVVEENPYEESVESILKNQYDFLGIVHRIDRVTSGVLLIAKKKSVLRELNKQFRNQSVKKKYFALVEKEPKEPKAILEDYLFKHQKSKKAFIYKAQKKNYFKVKLKYEFISKQENGFLLKITPYTGKFHQIRAQLANMGCPIVDDTKYNGKNSNEHLKNIALEAHSLIFKDPTTNEIVEVSVHEKFRYKN